MCAESQDDAALVAAASELAKRLNVPFAGSLNDELYEMLLVVTTAGLKLRVLAGLAAMPFAKPFTVDLARLDAQSPAGRSRRQPLARAVGLGKTAEPGPSVLDATAGWCEDAWLLASLGCRVLAVERSAVVAALAADGVRRAAVGTPETSGRLQLLVGDSLRLGALPAELQDFAQPEVIYLDPMFSQARKSAERRPLKILRQLVGDDGDADSLLAWARRTARRRVVVKRPLKGPILNAVKPATTHKGRAVRWDVYTPQA